VVARPDIVLLVLDTQRRDRLSCYGYQRETTPQLDRLAADATVFNHAVSTAQWTVPSHASMFTGLYPSNHTMYHASSVLSASMETLADRLSAGGYFTSAFCNNPLLGVVNNGLRRGFHSFLNYGGLMTSHPNQLGDHKRPIDRYRKHFKRLLANILSAGQDAFARSDTLLDFSFSPLMVPLWQTALSFKGNSQKTLNDAARQLVERKDVAQDRPIFSFINLMGTHMPYHPPRRLIERFAPGVLHEKSARHYLNHFNSDVFGWLAPLSGNLDEQQKAVLDGMYDAEVAFQDELVGEFIEKLRSSGRLDRTLLIICADHGEHLGEKQLMGHSISLYNELVHVPLIVRDPAGNLSRGTTVEHTVSTRRIFHTALTTAGHAHAHEETLTLALSAGNQPRDETVFAEGITPQNALTLLQRRRPAAVALHMLDQPRYAVWGGQYKLVQTGEERLELYNVFDDPGESTNLRDHLPEQIVSLKAALSAYRHRSEPVEPAIVNDDFDDDPEINRRLRDLGYIE
jgi:arylsulfatase A-like enzyme